MLAAVATALVLLPGTVAGGYPVLGSSPSGLTLRYIPGQPFGVGVFLENRSRVPVVVDDVRVLEPPGTLVHQIGTRLRPWNPPRCTGAHSCPAAVPPFGPLTAAMPRPVRVAPGRQVAVELDFRLGGCGEVPFASPVSPRTIEVTYSGGRELLSLGAARPVLRFPKPADCVPRPHSDISVTGPWATSSAWTIPGSAGDTCTRLRDGRVAFVSRWYAFRGNPEVRVEITPPHTVNVRVGIGLHGWTVFHARYAVVTTLRTDPKNYGGRFHATIVGRRGTTFRAYGAWRCTLR
jgi:hypothetical protein